jgi:cytoskeletal protein RodZ
MDVGTTLRVAREGRKLTLEQLAATTKIPVATLRALEGNAYEKVPSGIFVRGFIRAYAREVGLDPEETIHQFLAETQPPSSPPDAVAPNGNHGIESDIDGLQIDPNVSGSRPGWGYALIVAALIVGLISFNRADRAEQQAAESVTAAAAQPAASPDLSGTAAPAEMKAVATTGGTLRFEIEAQGPCWVKAVVGGKTVLARLMQAGDRESIDLENDVVLRVGDPGAFTYSINGRPGRPLGKANTPVTVRVTSDGQLAS